MVEFRLFPAYFPPMQAVFAAGGKPVIVESDSPEPAPGEALVEVHAAAVNRADLMQVDGLYPPPPGETEVLGLELAGTIVRVAPGPPDAQPNSSAFTAGDRVMGLVAGGACAQYAVVPLGQLMAVPDGLSLDEAAAIPESFITAYANMVEIAGLTGGERVLVHAGASGVGLAATQIACALGATVFATASAEKHEACMNAGATLAIDYRSENFAERILEVCDGVHVVVDMVGAPYWDDNVRVLLRWGRLVFIGLQGGARKEINLGSIMKKRLGVFGSTLRDRSREEKAALVSRFWGWAEPRFASRQLAPHVWKTMGLEQIEEAHGLMRTNRTAGKIVLTVR